MAPSLYALPNSKNAKTPSIFRSVKWLYETIKYPAEAKEKGIKGKVILRFIVTSEGKVENVSVIRGVDPLLDNEAVRAMNLCPEWIPGKMNGKPVNIYYSVPISFSLK